MMELDPWTGLPIGPIVELLSAKLPERITLEGTLVRLEPLNPAVHADALWNAIGGSANAALWQYMSEGPFDDRNTFHMALQKMAEETDAFSFAIIHQTTNQALGRLAYLNIKPAHRCIEIGNIVFGKELQRTPEATEALYLAARHGFEDLAYRRYEWKCNALNTKSRGAAERFGYVFEGLFREHMIVKGRSRDTAWYSILRSEWPNIKRALEAWLNPSNFDSHGRQVRRLQQFR